MVALSAPTRGDRWPDFWTTEGSDKVGIEVTEVVNQDHIAAKGYGVSQPVSVEVARRLLLSTIESKIAKHYAKPSTWKLWLLIYDVTRTLAVDDAAAAKIAEALRRIDHPFTEIWLIWPTAYSSRGSGSLNGSHNI